MSSNRLQHHRKAKSPASIIVWWCASSANNLSGISLLFISRPLIGRSIRLIKVRNRSKVTIELKFISTSMLNVDTVSLAMPSKFEHISKMNITENTQHKFTPILHNVNMFLNKRNSAYCMAVGTNQPEYMRDYDVPTIENVRILSAIWMKHNCCVFNNFLCAKLMHIHQINLNKFKLRLESATTWPQVLRSSVNCELSWRKSKFRLIILHVNACDREKKNIAL